MAEEALQTGSYCGYPQKPLFHRYYSDYYKELDKAFLSLRNARAAAITSSFIIVFLFILTCLVIGLSNAPATRSTVLIISTFLSTTHSSQITSVKASAPFSSNIIRRRFRRSMAPAGLPNLLPHSPGFQGLRFRIDFLFIIWISLV